MKNCRKCGKLKPLSEYYKHSEMTDGYLNICKLCTKSRIAKHRAENIQQIREYDRKRSKLPHRLEKNKLVAFAWKIKNPKRRNAQVILNNAIRSGKIISAPCFVCGEKAEAHHPDYDQPLDVVWLCPAHHKQLHAEHRKYLQAS